VSPIARNPVGVAAAWHFRAAAATFGAAAAVEGVGTAWRGTEGAGPIGWLALLGAGAWVTGLVWRERLGVVRAWACFAWIMLGSLLTTRLAVRHGFLFGRLEFTGREVVAVGGVPLSVPLLWWLVAAGGFLVVENLWGEWRAGLSAFTATIALQLGLMILPVVGTVRGYWLWSAEAGSAGLSWRLLAGWFTLSLVLAFILVLIGENLSPAAVRSRRQSWAPAAVLLCVTCICLGANLLARQWVGVGFGVANAVLFGAVVAWRLRGH
jgi:hypothetical protein